MGTTEKARLQRIDKLLVELRELQAKTYAITEELQQLAGGAATDTQTTKDVANYFDELWCSRYAPSNTRGYVWHRTRDFPNLRRVLKQLGREEVEGRILTFIKSEDPFYTRPGNRHAFGLFIAAINGLVSAAPAPREVWSCPDHPPCDAGTSQWKCHQRAELNAARVAAGKATL
jgi:hypothetical protein